MRDRFARSGRPVGAVLLDQSIVAGIGSVYRAGLLFLCGIRPDRAAASLTDDEFDGSCGDGPSS